MINAWSLLHEELNGTMDETYPITKQEDRMSEGNITIAGGDSEDTISFTGMSTTIGAADTVPIDNSWWGDDGFSVTGNPSGVGTDTLNLGYTHLPGGMGEDHINIDTRPWIYESPDGKTVTRRRGNSDKEVVQGDYFDDKPWSGLSQKPKPDLKNPSSHKYEEDKGIEDLKSYVSSTYQGHYTNKNSDVQTLDLIHSVGDAESFCRSNALKYLSRYDKKGSAKNDILKAMHYCLLLYYFSGNTQEPDYTNTRYETF